jgi:integrase
MTGTYFGFGWFHGVAVRLPPRPLPVDTACFFVPLPFHSFPGVVRGFADPVLTRDRTMRQKLTPAFVAKPPLPAPGRDRIVYWEGNFGLMVTAKGHRSYVVQYRAGKKSRRMSLKAGLSLQEARREARAIIGAVAKGADPLGERRKADASASNTLKAVAEAYMARDGGKLRTHNQRRLTFTRLIYPALGARQIDTIKRSEIVLLLDRIEAESGPHMAQKVLSILSKLFNWHASRDDDFMSPIVRGMARTQLKDYARDRTLSDDELRAVWRAAEAFPQPFGHFVRFLLLTATRRGEAARMTRDELAGGDWIISAARMKANEEHVIPLSKAAAAILAQMPLLGPYVFTLDGRRPSENFAPYKARLDEASGISGWRLHDLRRTARSLMSRAGVDADIAERCLAHVIGAWRLRSSRLLRGKAARI